MYIESLHIRSFGRLDNFDLTLAPGLNIIEGENESGKSTIAAFIKFMFYGASAKERTSYISWRTGIAAGTLTFGASGRRFRIERTLTSSGDDSKPTYRESVQMVDLATNMPCNKGEVPGELIFGVDADMFASTAYISQLGGAEPDRARVSEGIENLLFSADESVNTQRALAKLDAARVAILHKNGKGGRLYELENRIAELESRLDAALKNSSEIRTKEAQLADLRAGEAIARAKSELLTRKSEQFERNLLLGLYDRLHTLESKLASFPPETDDDRRPAKFAALAERISQLKSQLDELDGRRVPIPELTDEMEEFESLGGAEAIREECTERRRTVGLLRTLGIVALAIGVLLVIAGFVPALASLEPIPAIVGGAISLAGVALIIVSCVQSGALMRVETRFDIDELEAAFEARRSALEAERLNILTLDDLKRRLKSAIIEAKNEVGEANDMESLLAALSSAERDSTKKNGERSRLVTLIAGMREQLAPYNERELRDAYDADVDVSDVDRDNLSAIKRESSFEAKRAQMQDRMAAELEKAIAGLYPLAEDATKLSDRIGVLKAERTKLEQRLAALKLAEEKLAEASAHLRSSVAPRLAREAAELIAKITDGRYSELGLGSNLEATLLTDFGQKSALCLSAGTQDAVYLALRIALCSLIYRTERPPIICDDSFARIDDKRLSRLLPLLATTQTIILSSMRRESSLAEKVHQIKL